MYLIEKLLANGFGPGHVEAPGLGRSTDVSQFNDHFRHQQPVLANFPVDTCLIIKLFEIKNKLRKMLKCFGHTFCSVKQLLLKKKHNHF